MSAVDDVLNKVQEDAADEQLFFATEAKFGARGSLIRAGQGLSNKTISSTPAFTSDSKSFLDKFTETLFSKFGDTNQMFSLDVPSRGQANFNALGGMLHASLDLNLDAAFEFFALAGQRLKDFGLSLIDDLDRLADLTVELSTNLPSVGKIDFFSGDFEVNTQLIAEKLPETKDLLFSITVGFSAAQNLVGSPLTLLRAKNALDQICELANAWGGDTPLAEWERILNDMESTIDTLESKITNFGQNILDIIDGTNGAAEMYKAGGNALAYSASSSGIDQIQSLIDKIEAATESAIPDEMGKTVLEVTKQICVLKELFEDIYDAVSGAKFDPIADIEISVNPAAIAYRAFRDVLQDYVDEYDIDDENSEVNRLFRNLRATVAYARRYISEKELEIGLVTGAIASVQATIASVKASASLINGAVDTYQTAVTAGEDAKKFADQAASMGTDKIAKKIGTGTTGGYTQDDQNDFIAASREIAKKMQESADAIGADQARSLGNSIEALRARSEDIRIAAMQKDGDPSYSQEAGQDAVLNFVEKVAPAIDILNQLDAGSV